MFDGEKIIESTIPYGKLPPKVLYLLDGIAPLTADRPQGETMYWLAIYWRRKKKDKEYFYRVLGIGLPVGNVEKFQMLKHKSLYLGVGNVVIETSNGLICSFDRLEKKWKHVGNEFAELGLKDTILKDYSIQLLHDYYIFCNRLRLMPTIPLAMTAEPKRHFIFEHCSITVDYVTQSGMLEEGYMTYQITKNGKTCNVLAFVIKWTLPQSSFDIIALHKFRNSKKGETLSAVNKNGNKLCWWDEFGMMHQYKDYPLDEFLVQFYKESAKDEGPLFHHSV